jgi:hypothetical protein
MTIQLRFLIERHRLHDKILAMEADWSKLYLTFGLLRTMHLPISILLRCHYSQSAHLSLTTHFKIMKRVSYYILHIALIKNKLKITGVSKVIVQEFFITKRLLVTISLQYRKKYIISSSVSQIFKTLMKKLSTVQSNIENWQRTFYNLSGQLRKLSNLTAV